MTPSVIKANSKRDPTKQNSAGIWSLIVTSSWQPNGNTRGSKRKGKEVEEQIWTDERRTGQANGGTEMDRWTKDQASKRRNRNEQVVEENTKQAEAGIKLKIKCSRTNTSSVLDPLLPCPELPFD